jgi:hypothetical protein
MGCISTPGKLRKLRVWVNTAPGVGKSWTVVFRIGGVSQLLSVQISGADTYGEDVSNEIQVNAGNTVSFMCTPGSGPASCQMWYSVEWEGDNAGECNLMATLRTYATGPYYNALPSCQGDGMVTDEGQARRLITVPGTLSDLYVVANANPGGGTKTYRITLYVNGVAKALTADIVGTATTSSDLVNTVAVVAGDRIDVEYIAVNSPTAGRAVAIGFTFTPDTDGEVPMPCGALDPLNTSSTEYNAISIGRLNSTWNGTIVNRSLYAPAMSLSDLYVLLQLNPDAGNKYNFTLFVDGNPTALTVEISGTATSGNDTVNVVEVPDGKLVTLQVVPTSNPTVGWCLWGLKQSLEVAAAACFGLHPGAMAEMLS